ncbi:ATP-binding protein [Cytobacillus solani]|uniref:ATP-binding protein n=1 Tax=Cytobacillus solani TaxID=1637975 RepID=A0A0Q3VG72_9BACI|nr:ATP-binding protein [Cytobacillus solani]KOP79599.1 ATP-binding protein [Bacillus sp. FJAT-21945]KQL17607.1 ATP-binding protein [Cytobacillus solani]
MRDVLRIPFNSEESIVIASDNSGAIGLKSGDAVKVPYEMVSYYSFRVAVMECMAAGAEPFAVTLQNFCGDEAWQALIDGIRKGLAELELDGVSITGSTESNFSLSQSAIGITVLGKTRENMYEPVYSDQTMLAVIGVPLVGNELVEREEEAAPLSLFKKICSLTDVVTMPVGSRGILSELNGLFLNKVFTEPEIHTSLNLLKSSGPSTCFIAAYPEGKKDEVMALAGRYFYELRG